MNCFKPSSLKDYETFDDFFVRQHAPGSRPIYNADNGSKAIIVADSRVVVNPTLHETKKFWIKGQHFGIEELVLNKGRAKAWDNCSVASFRLSPQEKSPTTPQSAAHLSGSALLEVTTIK